MVTMSTVRRGALAKFRSGTAQIRLETGCYENIPEENRLIKCAAVDEIRSHAFNDFDTFIPGFVQLTDTEKLHTILSGDIIVRPAARYCQNILDTRRKLLHR